MSEVIRDEHDEGVYAQAFVLASAVDRFLRRRSTQTCISLDLLDADVVADLTEAADEMWMRRTQRVSAARAEREADDDER